MPSCPRCREALVPHDQRQVRTSRCPKDHGHFVAGAEVQRVAPRVRPPRLDAPLAEAPCPDCQVPMALVRVAGVEVDVCRRCGGAWFDADELEKAREPGWLAHATGTGVDALAQVVVEMLVSAW